MVHIGVYDDQQTQLDKTISILTESLDKYHAIYTIDRFQTKEEVWKILDEEDSHLDILFLDICTSQGTCLEFGKKLFEKHPAIKIVFITSFHTFFKDIFDGNVIYYCEKDEIEDRIDDIVYKMLSMNLQNKLVIRSKSKFIFINQKDIIYLERKLRVTYIEDCHGNTYVCNEKLNDIISRLNHHFIRVHESYIVNTDYISTIQRTSIHLNCDRDIPVSRKYHKLIKNFIIKPNDECQ